jgi:hypothetical protein
MVLAHASLAQLMRLGHMSVNGIDCFECRVAGIDAIAPIFACFSLYFPFPAMPI